MCVHRPMSFHGVIRAPQLDFYNWADQIHEAGSFDPPPPPIADILHPPCAGYKGEAPFSSGLVPIQLTLATQARAINSQHRARPFPSTSSSPSFCCLQIPQQAIHPTAGNHRAPWQRATVWLCFLFLNMLAFTQIKSWNFISVHQQAHRGDAGRRVQLYILFF